MCSISTLKNVDDFYLEPWIDCWSIDVNARIGKAWSALHRLNQKFGFFRATVETVLLYGSMA